MLPIAGFSLIKTNTIYRVDQEKYFPVRDAEENASPVLELPRMPFSRETGGRAGRIRFESIWTGIQGRRHRVNDNLSTFDICQVRVDLSHQSKPPFPLTGEPCRRTSAFTHRAVAKCVFRHEANIKFLIRKSGDRERERKKKHHVPSNVIILKQFELTESLSQIKKREEQNSLNTRLKGEVARWFTMRRVHRRSTRETRARTIVSNGNCDCRSRYSDSNSRNYC